MNSRHRARLLAELVSDAQHYASRTREAPEADEVRKAISHLEEARQRALESAAKAEEGDPA
jgi:hypothetical protein